MSDREYARRFALPAMEASLELLGSPLTRYQTDAAAAISEPDAAGTGFRWPVVCVLWPRQTGKTTLILATALGRARRLQDYRAAYAAQTGHITSQRFKEWSDLLRRRPGWARDYKTRDSDGTERITVRATHSYLRAFPPLPGRLRSSALDLVVVDESQEHDDVRVGVKLDADIQPVFDTRPRGQWIIAGTAGDLTSTYWRRHYQLAASGAPGRLLLEIGTPPPNADLDNPAVWAAYHPGVKSGRTTLAKLHQARDTLGRDRFNREYLNQWSTARDVSLFPPGAWSDCHRPGSGITGPVSLAMEVPPDRDTAVILAAGQSTHHPDHVHTEVIAVMPLALAVTTAADLVRTHRAPLWVDTMAPTATHIAALRRARVPTHHVTTAELTAASMGLYDLVAARNVTHLDQPPLTGAVQAAAKRKLGGRWAFDRHAPGGAVVTAAALAAHAHNNAPRDTPGILT